MPTGYGPRMASPSGEQWEIGTGNQRATIVEVGGGVREYEVDGRAVLEPYPVEQIRDGAHGAPLVPWPNRLADGRYSFDGQEHQLALTEPQRHNAIHGLLLWRPWRVVDRGTERLVMGARLHPLPGYPFTLEVRIAYELNEDGLSVTTSAQNIGERACPYGNGHHPYLSPGDGLIDGCSLQLETETRIVTDPERQLPAGSERCETPRSTSASRESSATSRSITRSPASHATPLVELGPVSAAPTGPARSCGWTRATRSSSCTPATPCAPTERGAGWPRSP